MGNYRFQRIDFTPEKINEYSDLFFRTFGMDNMTSEVLRWEYTENPNGRAVGFDAWSGSNLAAHYVTIPVESIIQGRLRRGLLSINTATDPAHQGRGLFVKLAEMTYQAAREEGYEFVVGVANHNSVHGFIKKLEFQHLGLLEQRLIIDADRKESSELGDMARVWKSSVIAWRTQKPGRSYFYRRCGDYANIYTPTPRRTFLALVNQVSWSEMETVLSMPNSMLKPLSIQPNPLKLWIGLDFDPRWKFGFNVRIPQRLRPIPLNLIFLDLKEGQAIRREHVRFWCHDFDAN